mgnify:CR=1 FL=1
MKKFQHSSKIGANQETFPVLLFFLSIIPRHYIVYVLCTYITYMHERGERKRGREREKERERERVREREKEREREREREINESSSCFI